MNTKCSHTKNQKQMKFLEGVMNKQSLVNSECTVHTDGSWGRQKKTAICLLKELWKWISSHKLKRY